MLGFLICRNRRALAILQSQLLEIPPDADVEYSQANKVKDTQTANEILFDNHRKDEHDKVLQKLYPREDEPW